MEWQAFLEAMGKFGLAAVLIAAIVYMFWKLLSYMLDQWSKIFEQYKKILDNAMLQNDRWQQALTEHTAQAKEFHRQVTEANQYQRLEHERMIKMLAEANAANEKVVRLIDAVCGKVDGCDKKKKD